MIKLDLAVSIEIHQCIAILSRMSKLDPLRPMIERELKWRLKGYYGEKETRFYLSFLPDEKYYIFHGLRLHDKKAFQMDLLILSKYFVLIAEIKNISGTLRFKKGSNQVMKEYQGKEEGISNPIQQVKRHHVQFRNWLRKKHIKNLPIESIALISKTSTIIETAPDNIQIYDHLIFGESLLDKINELEMKYQTPQLSKKKLDDLSERLLAEHTIAIPDILRHHNISPNQIPTGVCCPKCNKLPMIYRSANWQCPSCDFLSKTAHLTAVDDFFLLLSPTMTRKQFKDFLHIDSDAVAKNLLHSLNLPSTGTKRGTKYHLPKNRILSPLDENDIRKGEFFK
ncbi:nuclease-related domain-containing protein [Neobacillus sp. NPDC093127]|uniref:nuclease-related domain-containing protein n=1 Tax=Neobacillus sp. NPDC093127 TaxID=3364296 RepID=UPI00382D47BA